MLNLNLSVTMGQPAALAIGTSSKTDASSLELQLDL
jgi:hypothetical protein